VWGIPRNALTSRRTGFLGSYDKKAISAYRVKIEVLWGDSSAVLELDTLDYDREEQLDATDWVIAGRTGDKGAVPE
jgi:hypothetical protein